MIPRLDLETVGSCPVRRRSPIGSGPRIRTGRYAVNSRASPPRAVDQNEMVDPRGTAPRSPVCKTGVLPSVTTGPCSDVVSGHALRVFGAALSPDQLSERNWCGQGESNSRLNVGNVPRYHYAMPAIGASSR